MIIYSPVGSTLLDLIVGDNSFHYDEIMSDNAVNLYFSLSEYIEIPEGSYCVFEGQTFFLRDASNFKKINTRNFEYSLYMESIQAFLKDVKFKLFTIDNGVIDSSVKLKFSLTLSPYDFAKLICDNMNQSEGGTAWFVGYALVSDPVQLDFNHEYCDSALQKITDAFNTEWEIINKGLYLRKIEKSIDNPLDLQYGFNQGILPGIQRLKYDDSKIINRLYIEGSDKNINASTYGSTTLLLPKNTEVTYQGVVYKSSADGTYVERKYRPSGRIIEDSIDLTKIYPTRVGTLSNVIVVNDSKSLYDVVDSSIPEDLNYANYVLPGQTMTIIFQSGLLTGKQFDVKYINADKRFEIVPTTESSINYPQSPLIPAIGDKYAIFNISLPASYITAAQTKALWEAVKFLYENEQPIYSYKWNLDGLFAKRNWLAVGGYLKKGYYIRFQDPQFLPEPVAVRIVSTKKYINKPKSPEIVIANKVSGKSLGTIIKQIPDKDQSIKRTEEEQMRFTLRRFRDAQETISMLEGAIEGFSSKINPVAIETMAILIGSQNLQFEFVDEIEDPISVSHVFNYSDSTKIFSTPAGIIRHMTLGISSLSSSHAANEYKYWNVSSYVSPALVESSKPYYLYIKCSRTTTSAMFVLSETSYKFDDDPDYYYLLAGTLGSEIDGIRSFAQLYGFTELLPGLITLNLVKSPTGKTYFNLTSNSGDGEIGGRIVFKDTNNNIKTLEDFGRALEALKGDTTIQGGLLMTNLLLMRDLSNNIVSGLSGLNDGIFFFADPVDAYHKALNGTAMFIIRKNGTAKFGIMKIESDAVSIMFEGSEILRFQTDDLPDLSELVSNLDRSINVSNFSDSSLITKNDVSSYSTPLTVLTSELSQFTFSCSGTIHAAGYSDSEGNTLASSFVLMMLYRLDGSEYTLIRTLASVAGYDSTGITINVDTNFLLPAGSYVIRFEYSITSKLGHAASVSTANIVLNAKGSNSVAKQIFAKNGFARITNGFNYDYFSDEVAVMTRGENKYLKMLSSGTFLEIKGSNLMSGIVGAGSVSSGGSLATFSFGKVTGASRNSTGAYTITHSIGNVNYFVNLNIVSTNGRLNAIITAKNNNNFTVSVYNSYTNALTDSAFDFEILMKNE